MNQTNIFFVCIFERKVLFFCTLPIISIIYSIYDRLLNDAISDLTALLKVEDPTFGLPEGTKPPVS